MPNQQDLFSEENRAQEPTAPESREKVSEGTKLALSSTLKEAIHAFEPAMILKGFTDNTRLAFSADLRILIEYFGDGRSISSISTEDLSSFLIFLLKGRGRPCRPKSYARRVTCLKVFFGWLYEIGVLPADPAAALVHRPAHSPLPRVLSESEIECLLDAGRRMAQGLGTEKGDSRPLFLFMLLLQTGIKKSECTGIHLTHLDVLNPQEPVLHIRYETVRQKFKERSLRLDPALVPVLRSYREEYRILDRLFDCTARNLEYVLGDLAKLAGVDGGVSFECLRWTAALRDYRAGMEPEALRHKLGLSQLRWRETQEKLKRLAEPPH